MAAFIARSARRGEESCIANRGGARVGDRRPRAAFGYEQANWLLGWGDRPDRAALLVGSLHGDGAATGRAQAGAGGSGQTAKAERQKVAVKLDSFGTVTPIASVAIKSRVDTAITNVHFADGAHVKQGDLLFRLDCRQIDAEMKKTQAVIDGAQAQLEQAQRDVERYTELTQRNATRW